MHGQIFVMNIQKVGGCLIRGEGARLNIEIITKTRPCNIQIFLISCKN